MYDKDIKIRSNNKQWRKLVDYYNQMREEKFWEKWHFTYKNRFDEVHLISKKMWFIEWLVKENKIYHHKISDIMIYSQWRYTWINKTTAQRVDENFLDLLLMILSIQENPITVLLSILK